ncbi:MAG: VOC family protein [Rhizobiales bacterium]|nr:VOC family protein [Hyphomicrobiales bacterium]NRB14610.1 VOC family protein [Hyphomicrobiales bacterium]
MARVVKPIALTPYLTVNDGLAALAFYTSAFGAVVLNVHSDEDDQRIVHAHLKVGDIEFMMSDYIPEMNTNKHMPTKDEKRAIAMNWFFNTYADLCDFLNNCLVAGCDIILPFDNMYWGQHYGEIKDPFGYVWALSSPNKKNNIVNLM